MLSRLDLESKGQGRSRNQEPMTWGTKNMPPKKILSRGCLSNWCDADAEISKTICRPPPYGGVDIKIFNFSKNCWFQNFSAGLWPISKLELNVDFNSIMVFYISNYN